tara:strand:- start:126 stop:683 length:558 start_codon:yes stop_codon:yes gene_type:complete
MIFIPMPIRTNSKKMVDIAVYIKNKSLVKDEGVVSLASKYFQKAQHNILLATMLTELRTSKDARKLLHLPENYAVDDWVVIIGYYAMYSAAGALLAKLGYKSNAHNATVVALDHFLIKKKLLDKKHLELLERTKMTKEEIEEFSEARENREKAQYGVTAETTRRIAEETLTHARDFVAKVEVLLD